MRFPKFALFATILFCATSLIAGDKEFNADSAYVYTRRLSVTIGPRPMGSRAESRALHWAVDKFKTFGADSAFIMPFDRSRFRGSGSYNTQSGIAVGVFNGAIDSAIVIGGHIDSSGPEIPGANDDASGTASAIELARIWSKQPRRYTMVFAAFGGEESGLIGSTYFANHYDPIDKVALMLQLDMSASDDDNIIFMETKSAQAPRWLIEDVFAMERELGYSALRYPFYFFSLNSTLAGAGSDHEPFLDKGVPAIDFTAGVNNSAIHTPRDRFEFVDKAMMARTGKLANGLLRKYQSQGVPPRRLGHYMLLPLPGMRLFVPSWLVTGFVIFSLALAVLAWVLAGRNRRQDPVRVKRSGLKILSLMIIVAVFTQLGEAGLQLVKGLRYPWLAEIDNYLFYAAIWAAAGVWVAMQLTRRWRFSQDPALYARRALAVLFIITTALAILGFRLALLPSVTLLLIAIAVLAPNRPAKIVLGVLAPIPMFKLMFMEVFPMIARSMTAAGFALDTFMKSFLFSAALTGILLAWYLPAMHLYAYLLMENTSLQTLFRRVRQPAFGALMAVVILGYGGYLYSQPSFDALWRPQVRVTANYDLRSGESDTELRGNDFLRNVSVKGHGLDQQFDETTVKRTLESSFQAAWFGVSGTERMVAGEPGKVSVDWQLATTRPWYRVDVRVWADTLGVEAVETGLGHSLRKGKALFRWQAEPPDTLRLRATFSAPADARLIREVKATYLGMPFSFEVASEMADVSYRTVVVARDTLDVSAAAVSLARSLAPAKRRIVQPGEITP